MEPHIIANDEQRNRINNIRIDLQAPNYMSFYPNVRSYTLRNNMQEAFARHNNSFLQYTLLILKGLNPLLDNLLTAVFNIRDRSGVDRHDPLRTDQRLGLAYFPKGLTNFEPDKVYNDKDTAILRRILLQENAKDPECPDTDKSITIKIYESETYLHIYFNKYSPQTVKRMIILTMEMAYNRLIPDGLKEKYEIDGVNYLDVVMNNIFNPTESSAELIIQAFDKITEKTIQAMNENLIEEFATEMQKNLNYNRKSILDNAKAIAQNNYQNALQNIARYSTELKNANQALLNYTETEFLSIKVFLEKIKNYPNTKLFRKQRHDQLNFIIEEPILFTEDKPWSRYISNPNSNVREYIKSFSRNHYQKYNTTQEILDFSIQRLFKEVFVDQKIKLFTSSLMYLRYTDTVFRIYKQTLPNDSNFFPHPHLGSQDWTCWGDSFKEIVEAINKDDGERAFLQMIYAFQQMTATDGTIVNTFTRDILNTRYHNCTVFQVGKNTEKTTFEKIIKEFVEDETNKINTPSDTSSENGF